MNSVPVFVGLDYHSKSIQVCVVEQQGRVLCNKKVGPSLPEVTSLIEPLGSVQRVAIEACSGAADFGDHLHRAVGWRVSLAHPGVISRMRASIDKTDTSDARVIADLCRTNYLPEVWLPPEEIRELRTLVSRRHQRADSIQETKQRIKAMLRDKRLVPPAEVGSTWKASFALWLKELVLPPLLRAVLDDLLEEVHLHTTALKALDAKLKDIAENDPRCQLLMKFKGVGAITACTIRAAIGRFDRFRNGKQFARYCGLSPRNASSGERVADSGTIRAGNPMLKKILIQLAHRAARFDPKWNKAYLELRGRGKPACVAIVAVANRWCRANWHAIKTFEQTLEGEKKLAGEGSAIMQGGEALTA